VTKSDQKSDFLNKSGKKMSSFFTLRNDPPKVLAMGEDNR